MNSPRTKKYPYSKGFLFYLNKKSRGRRITGSLIRKYPNAFSPKLRRKYISKKPKSKSRRRRVKMSMKSCDNNSLVKIPQKLVFQKAQEILKLQKRRSSIIKREIKICWGMNEGDRKSSCNTKLANILKRIMRNIQNIMSSGSKNIQDLMNILSATPRETILRKLMSFIDLGVRIPSYGDIAPITVLINLIVFGATMNSDWQYYLLTPIGLKLLAGVINGVKKDREEFIGFLLHAHINGVSSTDVFSFIPQYIDICNPEEYLGLVINKGSRRLVYTLIIKGGATELILDQLKNMHSR
ncbi:MAG: hypothetical protein ACW98D_19775 [Promethearchaeota archaeon]|jgi:hypothetical protein